MASNSILPATLVAGDTWVFDDGGAFAEYLDPPWSLDFILRPVSGGVAITLSASQADGIWSVVAGSSATGGHEPGEYEWVAIATDAAADRRSTLGQGRVRVLPDPLTAGGDLRSPAARILAAIEATIEGRVTKDADSYSIEGRSISRTPMADLLRLRTVYTREVAAERNPGRSPIQYRRVQI
ncbi:MAG: hypothetical protein AAF376_17760 [Pseudomonadota bacterium]